MKENMTDTLRTIGANIGQTERHKEDFYATHPDAVRKLLDTEKFDKNIWECCAGEGHISKVLEEYGYKVKSTELFDRGYGETGVNFLECEEIFKGDIITNPPYKDAQKFIEKMLSLVEDGSRVACFLKIQFLESQSRQKLFKEHPPRYIYVFSKRVNCAKNGRFDLYPSSAVCYAWFIWEKGFKGEPVVRWL